MSGGGGPDGMALDEEGNIAVVHVGMGCAWLFSSIGEPMLRMIAPKDTGHHTTNCAYGGKDNKQLFITTSHAVLVADTPVAGKKMFSHM